ncbi:MAG: HAMP domain-containing histidine kinase [Azonexus sp.]|nr:HAMP domain-containing histidine kinase [Betaproteobacteria bacterium]MBK8919430.1 HAMP domain-containing histidine kinase [Betaproteobacteria bacterium]MBP6037634.1 HAMP domain-containing histidine kinase [Azonexus sp.]MBP6907887.1 HAMP domain-containing histidine kinase [Azonexus sp.]
MKGVLAWLASFRLRILFRTAFLALALAVLAMAVALLQGEKQRSVDHYAAGFAKTQAQIAGRLRHPAGQLALLNPGWNAALASAGRPVVLPFASLDFDDQHKVRNGVEMSGCLVRYPDQGSLCVAIGNNPWAGGFIYAAGSFQSGALEAHRIGDEFLDGAHRLRVTVALRGQTWRWIAPFEPLPPGAAGEGVRGRFTGYLALEGRDYTGARPVREFRGWVWQAARCLDGRPEAAPDCPRSAFFSLRLPVEALREALFAREKPVWPPPDLDDFKVRVEVLPPGEAPALFDSGRPGAAPAFVLGDLAELLQPGESLSIEKAGPGPGREVARLAGRDESPQQTSPLLTRLIRVLPVESLDAPQIERSDEITTPLGTYHLHLKGDARSVNRSLAAVATRLSWFVGAMLGAIGLAWLVIEVGLIRRIATLTRRTRGLARSVQAESGLERYDLADLKGGDELGLLAAGLDGLLGRVREDAERERIRAEQEKDQWHAVGHEIMSPLQSLLALHGDPADPSHRYISRMQQAVRVLYGSASPSEAFQSSSLHLAAVDMADFLRHVAANAGIADLDCRAPETPVRVRADEYALEDVFSHLLKNADRHRRPGTAITLTLETGDTGASVTVHNHGPAIAEALLERIFEYGVSDQPGAGANGSRGQGLFVARTYMAKMGGTLVARNEADGVSFVLSLPRARE